MLIQHTHGLIGLIGFGRKRRSYRRWHYFTSRSGMHYPMAAVGAQQVTWETRKKVTREKMVKDVDDWAEVKEQRAVMIDFVHEYGAGVRQSTCRSKTTKHEPGTLPLALSSATRNDLQQNTKQFAKPCALPMVPVASNLGTTQARAEVKYRAGDFVAVLPGGKQRDQHAPSGNIQMVR